jgi:predicted nucleic acid-binding protein
MSEFYDAGRPSAHAQRPYVGASQVKLVDASSWIEFLRGRESAPGQRVKLLLARGDAAWCDMTVLELWNGAQGRAEKVVLEELERELRLYPINEQVWMGSRRLARGCREKGITTPTADVIIAACAVEYGLELEHNDTHLSTILAFAAKLR